MRARGCDLENIIILVFAMRNGRTLHGDSLSPTGLWKNIHHNKPASHGRLCELDESFIYLCRHMYSYFSNQASLLCIIITILKSNSFVSYFLLIIAIFYLNGSRLDTLSRKILWCFKIHHSCFYLHSTSIRLYNVTNLK